MNVATFLAPALWSAKLSTATVTVDLTENTRVKLAAFSREAVVIGTTSFAVQSFRLTAIVVTVVMVWTFFRGVTVHADTTAAYIGPALAGQEAFTESW